MERIERETAICLSLVAQTRRVIENSRACLFAYYKNRGPGNDRKGRTPAPRLCLAAFAHLEKLYRLVQ